MAKQRKKRKSNSIRQLESEYRTTAPIADRFCVEVSSQINRLLKNQEIALGLPIEHRVKRWEAILEKLERVPLKIDSVKDLNDLVGLRLILLFKRDMLKVCHLLTDTFRVLNQYDTQERLKEDQFGYSSVHFIVELPESWLAVPTLAEMTGLKAEVQVRTFAQHIWAAASHKLQYKHEESVPPPIRRAIYRVSALLETVDLEFERVLEQRDAYRSSLPLTDDDARLNVDLLEEVLDSLLPADNKGNEEYSGLLTDLLHFEIDTKRKLESLISKHLTKTLEKDEKAACEELEGLKTDSALRDSAYGAYSRARAEKGAFYYHGGLIRIMLGLEFEAKWADYTSPD